MKAIYMQHKNCQQAKPTGKKTYIFFTVYLTGSGSVIAVSNLLQDALSCDMPLRETIIIFYIVNEAISILENISQFVPIPDKIKDVLKEFNETNR